MALQKGRQDARSHQKAGQERKLHPQGKRRNNQGLQEKTLTDADNSKNMKQAKETLKREQEYEKIIEEATVDCYDEDEAFQGMACTLSDKLKFPFDAKLLGQEVKVTGVDENSSGIKAGMIMNVSFNRKKYKTSLLTFDITDKNCKNNKLIEAYKHWVKK